MLAGECDRGHGWMHLWAINLFCGIKKDMSHIHTHTLSLSRQFFGVHCGCHTQFTSSIPLCQHCHTYLSPHCDESHRKFPWFGFARPQFSTQHKNQRRVERSKILSMDSVKTLNFQKKNSSMCLGTFFTLIHETEIDFQILMSIILFVLHCCMQCALYLHKISWQQSAFLTGQTSSLETSLWRKKKLKGLKTEFMGKRFFSLSLLEQLSVEGGLDYRYDHHIEGVLPHGRLPRLLLLYLPVL